MALVGRGAAQLLLTCAHAAAGAAPRHNETTAIAVDTFKAQDWTFSAANKIETFLKPRLSVICFLLSRFSEHRESYQSALLSGALAASKGYWEECSKRHRDFSDAAVVSR